MILLSHKYKKMKEVVEKEYVDLLLKKIVEELKSVDSKIFADGYENICTQFFCREDRNKPNKDFIRDLLILSKKELEAKYNTVKEYVSLVELCNGYKEYYTEYKSDYENRDYVKLRENYLLKNLAFIDNHKIKNITYDANDLKSEDSFRSLLQKYESILDRYQEFIKSVICYSWLGEITVSDGNSLHDLILRNYEISICPYCNRQYITSYNVGGKKKITADIDHFYPQSMFPLFALSLANMIPSCLVCNRLIKRNKYSFMKEICDLQTEDFDEVAFFEIKQKDEKDINSVVGYNDEIELVLKYEENKEESFVQKAKNTAELFRVEEIYQSHNAYVQKLRYKELTMPDSYKEQLNEFLGSEGLQEYQMNELIYGHTFRKEDFVNEPLGKLAYDVIARKSE